MSAARRSALAVVLGASLLMGGCAALRSPMSEAAAAADVPKPAASPVDPWERFNRAVFDFNDGVDRRVLIPLAKAYKQVVPSFVSQGFANMLSNVTDVWSAVNHLLQGKPRDALDMGLRFGVNTVFGLAGVLDVATEMGLERRSEDFGQTLGVWGFGPGPYVVIPFLGPSTVRDGLALPLDRTTSLSNIAGMAGHAENRYSVTFLELVHTRANLLNASSVLNQVALDRYSFVRDSYLARRRNAIYDGSPPREDDDDPPPPPKPAP